MAEELEERELVGQAGGRALESAEGLEADGEVKATGRSRRAGIEPDAPGGGAEVALRGSGSQAQLLATPM